MHPTSKERKEMEKAQFDDWGEAVRTRIWVLPRHISRRTNRRSSTEMLDWSPEDVVRKVGHPDKRWTDDIDQVAGVILERSGGGEWRIGAEDGASGRRWRRTGWPGWPKLKATKKRRGSKGAGRTSEGLLISGPAEQRRREAAKDLRGRK